MLERNTLNGKFGESERLILETVDDSSTEQGKPLPRGEVRSLACSPATLADWVDDENPLSGDVVAVYFAEKVAAKSGGQPWHDPEGNGCRSCGSKCRRHTFLNRREPPASCQRLFPSPTSSYSSSRCSRPARAVAAAVIATVVLRPSIR